MIDYLKVSATSSRYDDIDLLEKNEKIDVSKVPSPQDIRNKKKIEYIPRTIRVNEFTDASLKVMAEECDMNLNSTINAILDGYVNAHQDEIGDDYEMKERVLNFYLDRMLKELTDVKLSSEMKKWKRTIRTEEEPIIMEDGSSYGENFWRAFFNVTIYRPNGERACFEKIDDRYKKQHIDTFSSDFVLHMPEKKWYTAMSIFNRYVSKCNTLKIKRELNEESIKKLVDIINNSKTDKTLIKNLVRALKHSDKFFGVDEGSIWSWMF